MSARWFVYTYFFGEDLEIDFHRADDTIKYHCGGIEECPETGKIHVQGCINTWKKITAKKLCEHLGWDKTWLKVSKANDSREIRAYCVKGGEYMEDGVFVEEQGFRTDLAGLVLDLKKTGNLDETVEKYPEVYIKYHGGIKAYNKIITSKKI